MKKLLFAIAGAAAFSAFAADPSAGANDISLVGFENYTVDQTVIGYGDNGQEGGSLWSCAGDDASLVKAYAGGDVSAPSITEPRPFNGETNTKYLNLDTNGSELKRNIKADGTPQGVSTDPLYIDTLVQFTPSESAPTDLDSDVKLAIWLGVDSEHNTTNLYVQGVQYATAEIDTPVATAYMITNVIPQPGTWYRLTVKAIPAALSKAGMVSAFTVAIDGTEAVASQGLLVDAALATAEGDVALGENGYICTADDLALITANKVFGSMADLTQTGLTTVGFKGTGALDDFVVTTEEPGFSPAVLEFTLTWDSSMVSAVSYVLSTDTSVTNALTSGTAIQIAVGTTGTVELVPTFEDGYEFDHLQIGDSAWEYLTFPVPGVSTNGTLVAKAAAAYPTYIDTNDGTIKGKYDAWKTAYQADTASQWESAFLLNMDPTAQVAAGTALLKIASITEVSGGWELEIASEATTLTATDGTVLVGNGYLRIIAADTIAGLANATPTYINVAVTNGKITVTVPAANGKFMKAELTTQAPAQN